MELYLIRHGQSTNNALADQSGRSHDAPLTALGQQQAEKLAEFLHHGDPRDPFSDPDSGYTYAASGRGIPLTHLFVSPMRRTLQTAQPVVKALGIAPQVWVDIHENGGVYVEKDGVITGHAGMTRSQIAAEFVGYQLPDGVSERGWYDPARGHETLASCVGRAAGVAQTLRTMAQEQPEAQVALITHGTFMTVLIMALMRILPGSGFWFTHFNTSITHMTFRADDRILIRHINRVDHLPSEMIS